MGAPITKADLARRLGISPQRLDQGFHLIPRSCVVKVKRGGRTFEMISDPDGAVKAWRDSVHSEKRPLTGRGAAKDDDAPGEDLTPLAAARVRLDRARAERAELDLAERRGELVSRADVDEQLVGEYTRARTRLLGVPARVRQRDPSMTTEQVAIIAEEIHDSLDWLAEEDGK